ISNREVAGAPAAQGASALVLAATLGVGALSQQTYWSSDVLLFYRALKIAPKNDMSKENLSATLMAQGHFAQAVPLLQDAVQYKPQRWNLLNYLGISYYHLRDYPKAVDYLSRAIAVDPREPGQYAYLGLAQLKLGQSYLAAENFQTSLRLEPKQWECHFG